MSAAGASRPAKALRLLATLTDHWNAEVICRTRGPCALVEIGTRVADAVVIEIEERRVRFDSPLLRLGLLRGDLVRAVNGCELAGLDAALACYQRLRNVRYASVSVIRAGSPVTLDVALDRE